MRGNLLLFSSQNQYSGSIPAGAGEPELLAVGAQYQWVYPRGCGGTIRAKSRPIHAWGLSPRVRGNPCEGRDSRPRRRSIPAGAGEPCFFFMPAPRFRVYPRGCGGTRLSSLMIAAGTGLSPRVRGNHAPFSRFRRCPRSIPAGAGEPPGGPRRAAAQEVYPRGCGGTRRSTHLCSSAWGLSPRVRGNPHHRLRHANRDRSIPAGAGEPHGRHRSYSPARVYPRGCGGTSSSFLAKTSTRGLSPRVRGNLSFLPSARSISGSIPAGAGEPLRRAGQSAS